ncbi:putative F-box/kelch-repeat protein At1g32430 [Eutrema salsugineum]|uniref:putative F-box/kelch-repeat protein At1g32430 n=1 Tax=Eutrema salsugineum TaxID=72664 RepID=UPI000CECFB56|nr:putative F-box/kelch-repeat protein At1g32430 [Eutrema salsugineum]
MANKEKLPWDLVEEILSRVPPKPLVRFRTVCKRWNTLFDDKAFINNHKMTFRFILTTKSKIYSVSLNPEIEVRELNIPGLNLPDQEPEDLVDCNGLLLFEMSRGAVVCNPWLRQTRCISEPEGNQTSLHFLGIGYDHNSSRAEEIVYKTLSVYRKDVGYTHAWKIHDFATDSWKDQELEKAKSRTRPSSSGVIVKLHSKRGVLLNGNFFDFSREKYSRFCGLPCGENHDLDALVLRVFKGGRFSLLKQCHVTKKIEIWVTKNKINNRYGGEVKWVSFMEVSTPELPYLEQNYRKPYSQPSYFIDDKRDDKRLVMCSCDVIGRAWIYVVWGNKLISKIQLDSVVDRWPLHCTYFPSLVSVPGTRREEAELQMTRRQMVLLVKGKWFEQSNGMWTNLTERTGNTKTVFLSARMTFREVVKLVKEKMDITEDVDVTLTFQWPSYML